MVCQIINMFKDTGYRMAYCSRDGKIRKVLEKNGIRFFPIEDLNQKELDRVIKEYDPDVIHAHDMRAAYVSSKNSAKKPIVCHIHNNAFESRKISKKSLAFLKASLKISHIFWVSEEAMQQFVFAGRVRKKSSVLYNIIDIDPLIKRMEQDKNEYSFDMVFVGRLSEEKNPLRLIDVIEKVKKTKSDVTLAIVGDGIYKDQLEEQVNARGLKGSVSLLGFMDNPLKIIKDSSLMIMTSRREGLPMSALESQIMGTPVISTPVGAMKDIIVDSENGFLCESDDDFANSILSVLSSKEKKDDMSRRSLEFAKKFNNKDKYMSELIAAYDDAVK